MPAGCSQEQAERYYAGLYEPQEPPMKCRECSKPRAKGAQGDGCAAHELEWTLESDADDWVGGEEARREHLEQMFRLFKEGM